MKLIAIATCAAVCLSSSLLDAAEPPLPVVEEAQRYLEDGNYASCLHKISKQLASSNEARPGTAERYELLMLRGECLLRMRQPAPAGAAYEAAATCMKIRRDIARVATATAMAVLVKASPDLA